jgi:hypothetical protein
VSKRKGAVLTTLVKALNVVDGGVELGRVWAPDIILLIYAQTKIPPKSNSTKRPNRDRESMPLVLRGNAPRTSDLVPQGAVL